MRRHSLAVLCLAWWGCGPQVANVVMNADNNSGQSGVATVTAKGGGISVQIVVGPDPTDSSVQLAHIHHGRCGELGTVAWPLAVVGPTAGDPAHFSSMTEVASASFKEVTNGAYCINVHNHSDPSLYVSCGNID
jgi:hypothetical protein